MNVYQVRLNVGYGGDEACIPREGWHDCTLTVAAVDAEAAIERVKEMKIWEQVPAVDEEGDEIEDEYWECEDIKIHSVILMSSLDG